MQVSSANEGALPRIVSSHLLRHLRLPASAKPQAMAHIV